MSEHLFTADLHLGHAFVSRLRGFTSVEEHDDMIMRNLKRTVRPDDTLWVLGDISVSQHEYALDRVGEIDCDSKHLISGNHDPVHPMHKNAWKVIAHTPAWLQVFDSVSPYQRLKLYGHEFMLSHLPYLGGGDHTGEDRYDQYRLTSQGLPLLCGHVHDAWKHKGNMLNVGVDRNRFTPVRTKEVQHWLAQVQILTAQVESGARPRGLRTWGPTLS